MDIKEILTYIGIVVIIIENVLPHIKSVKANSTLEIIGAAGKGILKAFKRK